MVTENKFDKLRSMVHQGVPLEKQPAEEIAQGEKRVKSTRAVAEATIVTEAEMNIVEQPADSVGETVEPAAKTPEPTARLVEKRKRKPQTDYQSLFFNRIDFTHRKPLYITAVTHRRLMRIVHLMDESKATISSYVENIILNHLETFKEEIDTIYRTNNINPIE